MDIELELERACVKDSAKLMLNSFNDMYDYLKEKGDAKGKILYGNIMLRTAVLLDSLCNLHEKKMAFKGEEEWE